MLDLNKYFLMLGLTISVSGLFAETTDDPDPDLIGTVWELVKNGSQSTSFGRGQVVYFLSSDAHNTQKQKISNLGYFFYGRWKKPCAFEKK